MAILTVPQRILSVHHQTLGRRERFTFGLPRKVTGNRSVVRRGVLERLPHQLATSRSLGASIFANLTQHSRVLIWTTNDRNEIVVLSRGTNQTWPTDINLCNRFMLQNARTSDGCSKRIEINNN